MACHHFPFCSTWKMISFDTVDGRNPANSPVEVGSFIPLFYKGSHTFQVVGLGISSIHLVSVGI